MLSQQYPEAKILVSGGGTKDFKESHVMKTWLMNNLVSEDKIIEENNSLDTVENIIYSIEILKDKIPKTLCLITSQSHMERSYILLEEYIKSKDLKIQLMSKSYQGVNNLYYLEQERFSLFKDLGRILNIWYAN